MSNATRAWVRAARLRLKAELGNKCRQCGTTENLEFHLCGPSKKHHGIGTAARLTFYRRQASLNLVVLLCSSCHRHETERLRRKDPYDTTGNPDTWE